MKPMDAIVRLSSKSGSKRIINDTIKAVTPVAKDLAVAAAPVVVPVVIVGGTIWAAGKVIKKICG